MWIWKSTSTDSRRWRGVATAVWVLALLVTVACTENATTTDPTASVQTTSPKITTPTVVSPTELSNPAETLESDAKAKATATPTTTAPEALPTATPLAASPTATPNAPPLHHYATADEALAAAIDLGCSGWTNVTVNGINYHRACANDEQFESLVANPIGTTPTATATPTPTSVGPVIATPTAPLSTPFVPAATPTTAAEATPPPYHYATQAEAETGAIELGCSGFVGTHVGTTFYFRPCGSDADFEHFSAGGAVTLSGEACKIESDPTARFSALPTDLTKIASIVPAGAPAGGVIKPHSYFHNKNKPDGDNVRVPVYAVADSVLTSVAYYGSIAGTAEYLIFFDVTCEISFKYDHISEVAPKIATVAPTVPSNTSQGGRTDAITFEAGELIGYSVGAGGYGAWDFGAYDLTYTNQFANQERYVTGGMTQSLHTVCPYDYFVEPLKSQLYALLGTHDQRLLPDVECTTTERDVLGTASGAWFDSSVLNYFGSVVSIGLLPGDLFTITGIGNDLRVASGESTWLDPELMTTSHCYAVENRWFYLEIRAEGMQMALASGSGTCPATLPANATIYYR